MHEVTWASNALREHVAPVGMAQQVGERIRHAARALRWSYSRTRDIWYADPRVSVKPRELREIEDYTGLRYGAYELREVDDLISSADALLMGSDEDFYRPFVAAIRAMAGALHRAGTARRVGAAEGEQTDEIATSRAGSSSLPRDN